MFSTVLKKLNVRKVKYYFLLFIYLFFVNSGVMNAQNFTGATELERERAIKEAVYSIPDSNSCLTVNTAAQTTNERVEVNKVIVWNFFANKGLSGPQIAGIMGNMEQESNFIPTRVQGLKIRESSDPNSTRLGWGLIQWTPGGKIFGLLKKAGISTPVTDINTQLNLVWWHMNNESPTGYRDMFTRGGYKNINDVAEATIAFERLVEGAGKPMMGDRIKFANKILNQFSGSSAQNNPAIINGQDQSTITQNCGDNSGNNPDTSGDYKSLQEYILNAPNLQLSAEARGDIQRGYGSSPSPCTQSNLNINTLKLIKALLIEFPDQKFAIYTIISGHHCNAGFHPKGLGLDLNTQGDTGDTCNDKKGLERIMADVVMPFIFKNKDQLNINEMFYNADDLLNLTLNEGSVYNKKVSGHCNHIHLGVNPG